MTKQQVGNKKKKKSTGKYRKENVNRKWNESHYYTYSYTGGKDCLFTDNEITMAERRTKHNPEDLPIKKIPKSLLIALLNLSLTMAMYLGFPDTLRWHTSFLCLTTALLVIQIMIENKHNWREGV